VKRRVLVWLFFRIERALSVRVIEKNLRGLGLSCSDAKFVIKYYREAVKNI
jgi:hypothetical protein